MRARGSGSGWLPGLLIGGGLRLPLLIVKLNIDVKSKVTITTTLRAEGSRPRFKWCFDETGFVSSPNLPSKVKPMLVYACMWIAQRTHDYRHLKVKHLI